MEKIKDDAVLVFAGPADIDDDNMRNLLEEHIPQNTQPPVVQKIVGRGTNPGLRKVLAWLTEQYKKDGIDRPEDLKAYIDELDAEQLERTYLILLWGDTKTGGDQDTEELADYAGRLGIPVLALDHGLDYLILGSSKPDEDEQETPPPVTRRRSRRTQAAEASEPAASVPQAEPAEEKPPWEPEVSAPLRMPADEIALVKIVAIALDGALQAVRKYLHVLVTETQPDHAAAGTEQTETDEPASTRRPARSGTPAGTHTWLRDPDVADDDDPEGYRPQVRGRPRRPMNTWVKCHFTPAEEKERGLVWPEQDK